MIIGIKHRIRNEVYLDDTWPVTVGKRTFFIERDGDRATHVGVQLIGQDIRQAPTITKEHEGRVAATIQSNDATTIFLQHDLRAWQAMLSGYVSVDIDFDRVEISYEAETQDEEKQITIKQFTIDRSGSRRRESDEFTVLGRAFLAIEEGRDLITPMAFFREATHYIFSGRYIDSYNSSYLLLETLFCRGRTGTRQAVFELMKHPEVLHALEKAKAEAKSPWGKPPPHLPSWNAGAPEKLLTEIVELRGKLRHHNKNDPQAWSPTHQDPYREDAQFLASVAHDLAFARAAGRLWDDKYTQEFFAMSDQLGTVINVVVAFTLKEGEVTQTHKTRMRFPGQTPTPKLAKSVLRNFLDMLDERNPGASLLAIRAHLESSNEELLRYDFGPGMPR